MNQTLPAVSGTAQQGQTFRPSTGTWTNSPTGYSYQWQRCDSGGNSCSTIGGATSQTYLLVAGRCRLHDPGRGHRHNAGRPRQPRHLDPDRAGHGFGRWRIDVRRLGCGVVDSIAGVGLQVRYALSVVGHRDSDGVRVLCQRRLLVAVVHTRHLLLVGVGSRKPGRERPNGDGRRRPGCRLGVGRVAVDLAAGGHLLPGAGVRTGGPERKRLLRGRQPLRRRLQPKHARDTIGELRSILHRAPPMELPRPARPVRPAAGEHGAAGGLGDGPGRPDALDHERDLAEQPDRVHLPVAGVQSGLQQHLGCDRADLHPGRGRCRQDDPGGRDRHQQQRLHTGNLQPDRRRHQCAAARELGAAGGLGDGAAGPDALDHERDLVEQPDRLRATSGSAATAAATTAARSAARPARPICSSSPMSGRRSGSRSPPQTRAARAAPPARTRPLLSRRARTRRR